MGNFFVSSLDGLKAMVAATQGFQDFIGAGVTATDRIHFVELPNITREDQHTAAHLRSQRPYCLIAFDPGAVTLQRRSAYEDFEVALEFFITFEREVSKADARAGESTVYRNFLLEIDAIIASGNGGSPGMKELSGDGAVGHPSLTRLQFVDLWRTDEDHRSEEGDAIGAEFRIQMGNLLG